MPLIFACFVWWLSTGIVLWRARQNRETFAWTALTSTFAMMMAMLAVFVLRNETSVAAAYGGFIAGIILWGWHEVLFLLGYISGPNKDPCPKGLALGERFIVSAKTVIHHEIAIVIHGALVLVLSWQAPNMVAFATFAVLWAMRLSSKLLIFSGAPRINEALLPAHLEYLGSYFSKATSPPAFFLSTAMAVGATAVFAALAGASSSAPFASTQWTLLATLSGLAVLELIALVAPIPDRFLWAWALPPEGATEQDATADLNTNTQSPTGYKKKSALSGTRLGVPQEL